MKMTSIKVKFRPSTVAGNEGVIYYQIIHDRKVRQLVTDYRVYPSEWDQSRSIEVASHKSERRLHISSMRENIRRDIEWLTKLDRKLAVRNISVH